jgi:excinuclease ABC subunit A
MFAGFRSQAKLLDKISVRGARTHNLRNINLEIPRDKLVVITGLSGSGKSSLAFDTLYAEGQRRYVESLSAYARQFLSMMEKPDVDHIEGLSPAISIEQKSTSHNPRSTVGTITEIYDYLRLLFARVGEPRCPTHGVALDAQTVSQMVDQVLALPAGTRIMVLAPVISERKGEHLHVFKELLGGGFIRARIDGIVTDLDTAPELDKNKKHSIEAVVDRLRVGPDIKQRLAESFETALALSDGIARVVDMDDPGAEELIFSARFACPHCGYSITELEPRMFSFNNPAGACGECDGLGVRQFFDPDLVVQDEELTLAEGAIRGWDRRNVYYFHMLTSLAAHYGFDVETPFRKLKKKHRDAILFGSGRERINFSYANDRGDVIQRSHRFEGVIPNMERRYRETDSGMVREHLQKYLRVRACPGCNGTRLREASRHVFIGKINLPEVTSRSVEAALTYFDGLKLTGRRGEIADKILKEIRARLRFLVDVGLNYLTLDRSADTLSGGEAQRIRLASQIGAGLVGVMYILDEPSIGLHQRDNERLLRTLNHLRDLGNSVLVVEHDEEAIRMADFIIDIGPGAGVHGGQVVASGTLDDILAAKQSITGQYLSGRLAIEVPAKRTPPGKDRVRLVGANGNNLQCVTLEIPCGLFTCITGVSGSGKSTLINHTLFPVAATALNNATTLTPAPYQEIHGLEHLDKVVDIDQSPIGRTPRSNPATYTGLFTPIRELFAQTQEARARGYQPGRFSFNVKGGRCEACQGDGVIKVEMHFLPDIYVPCDVCKGKRYNRETLDVRYKGKNITEVLEMTVEEAREFFDAVPMLSRKLQTLMDVGLSYIRLGQSATTLSGGEAQRVKLSRELSKRDTGRTLYILDEPTTGLHFHDIAQLLAVLHRLRDQGNTIVVIEHNLDVIKTADWIVDLGPEGGSGGGQIIAEGTPEDVAKVRHSHTGRFLRPLLKR